ncbi:MAG: hypothetical protein C5B50_08140 [Verrucomicrobia bacterium]|nr:MAG: hypothetical protein C5B50_08140 [Verrucomicrobiota bacterium]
MDFGLWTLDFGLWTLDFGLWTLDGLWTALRQPNPALDRPEWTPKAPRRPVCPMYPAPLKLCLKLCRELCRSEPQTHRKSPDIHPQLHRKSSEKISAIYAQLHLLTPNNGRKNQIELFELSFQSPGP